MSNTLYEIGEDLRALEDLITEMDGDITDEAVEETIDKWIAENAEKLESKLDGYGMLIRNRSSIADARKKEADRLQQLANSDLRLVDRLKNRLLVFFQIHKKDRIETEKFKFWRQRNGGVTPIFFSDQALEDPSCLPKEFTITKILPDTEKIRKILESDLPENAEAKKQLEKFVQLGERGEHLRIK